MEGGEEGGRAIVREREGGMGSSRSKDGKGHLWMIHLLQYYNNVYI